MLQFKVTIYQNEDSMKYLIILCSVCLFFTCASSKKDVIVSYDFQEELLDTMAVVASSPVSSSYKAETFRSSAERLVDLIHMDLRVAFDWEKQEVLGKVDLLFKPYFYTLDTLVLDAVQMSIYSISMNQKDLNYKYDGKKLKIALDKQMTRTSTGQIQIEYTAQPMRGYEHISSALPDNLGLYFIRNPKDSVATQIWTQGETSYNSRWFPTIDAPNERMTHDIRVRIPQVYQSLSNGTLVQQSNHEDGTRTDHWQMKKAHAPYLVALVVGDFAVVDDQWLDVPLQYYVAPPYEADAKAIFNHTAEMLDYFSELLGVPYPWDSYKQAVVHQFVAGAMENTTASIFGDFVQKTKHELIDNNNDNIVAHELFHHWFGNSLTCESWADLTLNEGFASYSEYLWKAYKYGQDEADMERYQQLQGYLYQAQMESRHPLIHYSYKKESDMFDAHSYNKGSLVLHLLRSILGDEAFFLGVQNYLKKHAGSSVEADQLRLAFEEVSGKDLKLFFKQWYFSPGHPELEIMYNKEREQLQIDVEQVQVPSKSLAVFQLTLDFDLYLKDGRIIRKSFEFNKRSQKFIIDISTDKIAWINFDPKQVFIGTYRTNMKQADYVLQYRQGKTAFDQYRALVELNNFDVPQSFYSDILKSKANHYHKFRALAHVNSTPCKSEIFESLLAHEKNTNLKILTLDQANRLDCSLKTELIAQLIKNEKRPSLVALATTYLGSKNYQQFTELIPTLKAHQHSKINRAVNKLIAANHDAQHLPFLLDQIKALKPNMIPEFMHYLNTFLGMKHKNEHQKIIEKLFENSIKQSAVSQQLIQQLRAHVQQVEPEKKAYWKALLKTSNIPLDIKASLLD